MFQKHTNGKNDFKSENERICPPIEGVTSNNDFNKNDRITSSASSSKQLPYQNYFNSNIPKEDTKSHKQRTSNFHSLSQQVQSNTSREMQPNSNINHNLNQRHGHIQSNLTRSTTNPQLHQQAPQLPLLHHGTYEPASPSTHTKSAFNNTCDTTNPTSNSSGGGDSRNSSGRHQLKQRLSSTNSAPSTVGGGYSQASRDGPGPSHRQDHQHEKETNEVVTMIREEMENNFIENFKESDLDTLGSLELPIELSFLLRQQAICMAKMNYLDRQIRELKEARQEQNQQQTTSTASSNQNPSNRTDNITNITTTHSKNGNFIPSDDSGGEYSRATISDDDELSSLLDQIAKSVRPDRNINPNMRSNNSQPQSQQHLHQQRTNYNAINQQPQSYAILTPNHQLHHQAVPVFVMSSPIAMAHPSSISSTVLPGVHFQPEPRYNQYYEDFYVQNNNSSSSTMRNGPRHNNGLRSSQQFDSHISAIEQLVSQKEKRQIKSQLKSADNWLKMRSSGFCNLNDNFNNSNNANSNGTIEGCDASGSSADRATAPSDTNLRANSNSVIEE